MLQELTCGFCSESLEPLTLTEREEHYEAHFLESTNDVNTAESSLQSNGERIKNKFHQSPKESWRNLVRKIENDVFWYPSLGVPPPRNYTPGLIPILKCSLTSLCSSGKVAEAVLCHEKVVHISKELWDAPWGCGYRNFLMLCTGLFEQESQPSYFPLLDAPPGPSVRNLQSWIQHAWNDGYDAIGCKEMRNKIIGTSKWIGTAEIYTALSHRGIAAELVDFKDFKDKESCATAVLQWMLKYFTPDHPEGERIPSTSINDILGKTTPVVITQLMPVILQHRGHSRLIVGYERDKDGTVNLLTFDTGRLLPQSLRNFTRSAYPSMNRSDNEQTDKVTLRAEQGKCERQQTEPQKRPITLTDLLTPSERELARDHLFNSEKPKHSAGTSMKSKFVSRLRVQGHKKVKGPPGIDSMDWCKREPGCHQVFKAFKLTAKQLALNKEYQVLYIPLRPPLTEEENSSRKVALGEQITRLEPQQTI